MTPVQVAKRASLRKLSNLISPVPADIDVAQAAPVVPIKTIAAACGLTEEDYEPYGHFKAKISEKVSAKLQAERGRGYYVVVAGINPTPLGEGKSTTTIGLAQAMGAHLEKECVACIRQPSMGPTFGIKGGAAGGGAGGGGGIGGDGIGGMCEPSSSLPSYVAPPRSYIPAPGTVRFASMTSRAVTLKPFAASVLTTWTNASCSVPSTPSADAIPPLAAAADDPVNHAPNVTET